MKPEVVFVLGGPGAGKGTQCEKIVREFGYVHLSAGDLLREERKSGSEHGQMIDEHIRNGTIVPVEVTCSLLEKAMHRSEENHFLIDGFPRNENNLHGWNEAMSEKVKLLFVLFFDCSEEACIERCLNRGKAGSGRTDDNVESLKKRLVTYNEDTMPIIDHYRALSLVRQLDASKSADEVFEEVKKIFQALS